MGRSEDDEDFDGQKPRSKRKKLALEIERAKIPIKDIEAFLRSYDSTKSSHLFSVPPCQITEAQFCLRYGLLAFSHKLPAYDRFRQVQMSDESLRRVSALMAGDAAMSSASMPPDAEGEQQFSPLMDRFLRSLVMFTRVRPSLEDAPTYEEVGEAVPKKAGLVVKRVDDEDEQIAILDPEEEAVDLQPPKGTSFSQSSNSSDSSEDQTVAGQTFTDASPRQHSDFKIYVYLDRHTVEGRQLKLVVDLKTLAKKRDLFQAAVYAIQDMEATSTFSKRYRPPVYLLVQDKHKWLYGILEIDGYVKINKGEIDPQSLEAFPEMHQPAISSKFTPAVTQAEVVERFNAWKEKMAAEGMQIPETILHPVGRVFYRVDQAFEMPRLSSQQTQLSSSQKRLYEGLLKIVAGCRVIGWSPKDVVDVWSSRSFMRESFETSGCSPNELIKNL